MFPQRWSQQSESTIVNTQMQQQRTQLVSTQNASTARALTSRRLQSANYYGQAPRHAAARQYIDYCNGMNTQPVPLSRERSFRGQSHIERPQFAAVPSSDEISLEEVLSVTTGANVVSLNNNVVSLQRPDDPASLDEDTLIEAVQTASLHPRPPTAALMHPGRARSRLHQFQTKHSHDCRCPSHQAQNVAAGRLRRDGSHERRWVEVREDNQGRLIDLTVMRPNTPHLDVSPAYYRRSTMPYQQTYIPPAVSSYPVSQPYLTGPAPACANCALENANESSDATRQALLAIYQAGKPDEKFLVRAPSTAAIQSAMAALSLTNTAANSNGVYTHAADVHGDNGLAVYEPSSFCNHVSCQSAGKYGRGRSAVCCRRVAGGSRPSSVMAVQDFTPSTQKMVAFNVPTQHHSNYLVNDVTSRGRIQAPSNVPDSNPVKVNIECASNTDAVVRFRVQSLPVY